MRRALWYFDFVSPFAWIGLHRLKELPADVRIEYRPVLFAAILQHWGQKGPAEISAKRRYSYRWVHWWAAQLGVPTLEVDGELFWGAENRIKRRFIPAPDGDRTRSGFARDSRSTAVIFHDNLRVAVSQSREEYMYCTMRYMAAVGLLALGGCATAPTGDGSDLTFFITSVGPGKGGDLGGLEGADRHCQKLAGAVGAGNRTWRAYLSTQGKALNDPNVVHARDRIGAGPWHNAKGVRIARSVEELHSAGNNLTKETALDEKGQPVNDRTMKPNKHDMLTGSRTDGTAFAGAFFPDMTCGNWTRSGPEGSAMTGHHDRAGPIDHPWATSWNSAHPTRGCTPKGIESTGGDGLFYCFAAK